MRFIIGSARALTLVGAVLAVVASPAFGQQTGTISGRVIDKVTNTPLVNVQVTLGGTTRGALTDRDGKYEIRSAPAATIDVHARLIGYSVATQSVTVTAGGSATADFALSAAAITLDQIVATPTGQEAAREATTALHRVDARQINTQAAPTNITDLLNARLPGVNVMQSGGTSGTGTRIRIRGSNSVSLSNEPVLIVDGIRVENGAASSSVGVGGQVPSRLNDFDPMDLEAVQVASGPSSGVLYGTDAANGVISLQTRQGRAGPTRWEFSAEGGALNDVGQYPFNYTGLTSTGTQCILTNVEAGSCTQASLRTFNPLVSNSPFQTGNRSLFSVATSGGSEQTTFYLAGHYERENGVYAVNRLRRVSLRANVHDQARSNLDFLISSGYTNSALRLPENDNNVFGVLSSGFLGLSDSSVNQGYGFLTPAQSFSIRTFQDVDRFTGSLQANYRPFSFLEAHVTTGTDFSSRYDQKTFVPGAIPQGFNNAAFVGSRQANPFQIYSWTANVWGSASFALTPAITSSTQAGVQYYHNLFHGVIAQRLTCAAGTSSLTGCVTPLDSETTQEFVTLGRFGEERLSINNRIFLSGALRSDDNTAFGKRFGHILYPKLGGSWVVSEEPFFPSMGWLSSLRVRASWGKSGLHPGPLDALQFFAATPVVVGATDVSGITFGQAGDAALKPERVAETDAGLDVDAIDRRLHFEFTYYNKTSHDALVAVTLPPACGCGNSRFQNLGQVNNKGIEITASLNVLNKDNVGLELTASAWGNKNRVITLGQGVAPIIFGLGGFSQRIQPGYAAGAYFFVPYTFNDANNDGVLGLNEVTLGTGGAQFLGQPFPDHGGTLSADLTLLRRFHLYGLLDGRFGNKLFNSTEQFRCGVGNCAGINDPKASLADQAAAVANLKGTQAGYIQDGGFTKLREVSLTYDAPSDWARRIGATSLSVSVAGRNLHTWTKYRGVDPELNEAGQNNFTTADFLTQPPVRYWIGRVNLTF
jgi:TonB-linked SusC/RagA family outer membrane protein